MINEFCFSSSTPNLVGFGQNLGLVEIFKVIQCHEFHWTWTKPHDTLGNVSDKKTTLACTWKAMNIFKDLVWFMFQISTVEIRNYGF
jgi:hypothetical protein